MREPSVGVLQFNWHTRSAAGCQSRSRGSRFARDDDFGGKREFPQPAAHRTQHDHGDAAQPRGDRVATDEELETEKLTREVRDGHDAGGDVGEAETTHGGVYGASWVGWRLRRPGRGEPTACHPLDAAPRAAVRGERPKARARSAWVYPRDQLVNGSWRA